MKKYGLLAMALVMSMSSVQADSQKADKADKEVPPNYMTGGPVVGFAYSTFIGGAFQVGYYGEEWLFDVGANTSVDPVTHSDTWFTGVMGHLGGRSHMHKELSLTYGLVGVGHFQSHSHSTPWTVGAFTGLDYQISKNFLLSGKVYPYNYNRHTALRHQVFANTTISFFYVF